MKKVNNINRIHLVCVSFPIKLYVCCFEDNFLFVCVCVCLGYIKSGYTVSKEKSWLVYSKKVANVISITVRYTIECCLLVIVSRQMAN